MNSTNGIRIVYPNGGMYIQYFVHTCTHSDTPPPPHIHTHTVTVHEHHCCILIYTIHCHYLLIVFVDEGKRFSYSVMYDFRCDLPGTGPRVAYEFPQNTVKGVYVCIRLYVYMCVVCAYVYMCIVCTYVYMCVVCVYL